MAGLGQGLLWDGNVCGLRVLATRGSSREGLMVTVSPVEQLRAQRERGVRIGGMVGRTFISSSFPHGRGPRTTEKMIWPHQVI